LKDEARDQPIEVLECNWQAFEVFMRCDPSLSVGMGGGMYTGYASAEIQCVMELLGVRKSDRVNVFDAVKHMGRVWCEVRNAARATA